MEVSLRILHICLSNFYIDGYNYQENLLPRVNKEDGNEVKIIASTEVFGDNIHCSYCQPKTYITEYGVPIVRLPYRRIATPFVTHKLRYYSGVYNEIEIFKPDVIMMHSMSFGSLKEVVRYKKIHPEVKLYADTHAAAYNSGGNWLSLHVLHRRFYKRIIRKALPYIEKYFYIGELERKFSIENYGVPESLMEYYPLGGIVLPEDVYRAKRVARRSELGVTDDELVIVHSGKFEKEKRTKDLVQAFSAVPGLRAKLFIIGSFPEDVSSVVQPLIDADDRIAYLGWKTGAELLDYLCACDLYAQPGSCSATFQNSICNRCAVMSFPKEDYVKHYQYGNIIWVETTEDMRNAFTQIANGTIDIDKLRKRSEKCAEEMLDYHKLAKRLYL